PHGNSDLLRALRRADNKRCRLPGFAGNEGYDRFINAMGWYQYEKAPDPIPISQEQIAAMLEISQQRVSVLVERAVDEGLLRLVKKAVLSKLPAEYRFATKRFQILQDDD